MRSAWSKITVIAILLLGLSAVADTEESNIVLGNDPEGLSRKPLRITLPAWDTNATEVTVAAWNVENLYDYEDDPETKGDNSFTPRGWTHWYIYRYIEKLEHVAEIISEMEPDVVVLSEVENRRVVDDLCDVLSDEYQWPMPYVVHTNSQDSSALDVAIIARYKPSKPKWIENPESGKAFPMVDFKVGGRKFTVIGCRWEERIGGMEKNEAERLRCVDAGLVRDAYLRKLKRDPNAAIIVAGDFNDEVGDASRLEHAGFLTNAADVIDGGTNLLAMSFADATDGTFYYSQSKTWFTFDGVNVSRGLLPEVESGSPWYVATNSYAIYKTAKQCMETNNVPYPYRRVGTPTGHRIMNGYSDHFPVVFKIKAREGALATSEDDELDDEADGETEAKEPAGPADAASESKAAEEAIGTNVLSTAESADATGGAGE